MRPRHLSSAVRARVRPAALAAVLLGVLPAVLVAQRGDRSRGGAGSGAASGTVGDPAPTLRASDVARLDPIAMLIGRAGELGLADSQVVHLGVLRAALQRRNAPALQSLDSLLGEIRRHAADTAGTDGERLMRTGDDRRAFAVILGRIRDHDDEAALEAMDLFSGRQLRWAFSVVQEQRAMMRAVARGGTVPPPDSPSRELPIPITPAAPPPLPLAPSGRTPCVDSC